MNRIFQAELDMFPLSRPEKDSKIKEKQPTKHIEKHKNHG